MGGFECAAQRRSDGVRLDVTAATAHDRLAALDYAQLATLGLRTVRDGLRWHLIERAPGNYDWSSFNPMLAAARATGTQVIWDLLHYGWPDWTDPFDDGFIESFARFAETAARRIAPGGHYVAINEISFLAWGGGEVGYLNPFAHGRGEELKMILCRAAIAATHRIRAVDPAATMICAEPLIRVHPVDDSPAAVEHARARTAIQYDATDCLLGRRNPEHGGDETMLDVIGINYYPQNQWWDGSEIGALPADRFAPLSDLLVAAAQHFRRPLLIAETGCEGDARAGWFTAVAEEAARAEADGVELLGICLYPILDHPGWDDDRHCENGLLCGFSQSPRPVHAPLAAAIADADRARSLRSRAAAA